MLVSRCLMMLVVVLAMLTEDRSEAAPQRSRVPFYCKRLKLDCSKSSPHICCPKETLSTTVSSVTEAEVSNLEALSEDIGTTTQQSEEDVGGSSADPGEEPSAKHQNMEYNNQETEATEQDREDTEQDREDTEQYKENTDQDKEDTNKDNEDTEQDSDDTEPEDGIEGAASQVQEVVVDPETGETVEPISEVVTTTAQPEKYAPKICLVIKFNCELRKTHPCCIYPLPPKDGADSTTTPKVDTKKPALPKRPGNKPTEKTPPVKQAGSEKTVDKFRPVRPGFLRRPLPGSSSSSATTTPPPEPADPQQEGEEKKNTQINNRFRRPERVSSSPSISSIFSRRKPINSLAALRKKNLCRRLSYDCEKTPSHQCCEGEEEEKEEGEETSTEPTQDSDRNQPELEENKEQGDDPVNEEKIIHVEDNNSDIATSNTNAAAAEDSDTGVEEDAENTETGVDAEITNPEHRVSGGTGVGVDSAIMTENLENPDEIVKKSPENGEEIAVSSNIASISSTETRVILTTSPRRPSSEVPDNAQLGEETFGDVSKDEYVNADLVEEEEIEKKKLEGTQPENDEAKDDDQYEAKIETVEEDEEEIAVVELHQVELSQKDSEPKHVEAGENEYTGEPAVPTGATAQGQDYSVEYPTGEEGEYYYVEYEYEVPADSDRPRPVFVPASPQANSVQVISQLEENNGPVFIPENPPQIETILPEDSGDVLEANQIVPRVSGECFRFDCLSFPSHDCCLPARNTRKRQIASADFGGDNLLNFANHLREGEADRITYSVSRVEKNINW